MPADQLLRALASHDSHGGGIDFKESILVLENYPQTGAFEESAELFFRLAQRLLRALALGVINDAGTDQIITLGRQAKQSDLGWDEPAIGLPVSPFKNRCASGEG